MTDHRPLPEPDAFLGYTLVRVAHVIERRIEQRLRQELGLTVRQFGALAHLDHDPGIGSGKLARLLMITPQSAGPLVDGLATRGLVDRDCDARPGTRMAVSLTTAGKAALVAGYAIAGTANDEDFAVLSAAQRAVVNEALHAVLAALMP